MICSQHFHNIFTINLCRYLFLQRIFYKPNSTKPDFLVGSIHVLYFIYSFKHSLSPCNILGKLRKYGLEGMSRFPLDLLRELSPCVLPSGQRTLVAPQVYGGGLVPKISTPTQLLCSG